MKLNAPQWLWLVAVFLVFATVLLDVANVANIPPIYWMLGFGLLTPIGWWVMPSMKELESADRHRKRNVR